jgi:threonine/homoserine/homoserine lactone efflux protein
MHLLPAGSSLALFVLASLILAVTPGPAVLYVIARSLSSGRRAGLASVAGVALGNLGNSIGASLGLAVLFSLAAWVFFLVKYLGAAYLIYLGVRTLCAPRVMNAELPTQGPRRIFRDGFLVALLNPKTTLFFAAFVPQFLDPRASSVLQTFCLGAAFVLIASVTDSCYALAASSLAPLFERARGRLSLARYLTAGAFIGLGVYAAASGSRPATQPR